jgi:hypothetical protein
MLAQCTLHFLSHLYPQGYHSTKQNGVTSLLQRLIYSNNYFGNNNLFIFNICCILYQFCVNYPHKSGFTVVGSRLDRPQTQTVEHGSDHNEICSVQWKQMRVSPGSERQRHLWHSVQHKDIQWLMRDPQHRIAYTGVPIVPLCREIRFGKPEVPSFSMPWT